MGLPHNLRLMHRFSIPVVYAVRYLLYEASSFHFCYWVMRFPLSFSVIGLVIIEYQIKQVVSGILSMEYDALYANCNI